MTFDNRSQYQAAGRRGPGIPNRQTPQVGEPNLVSDQDIEAIIVRGDVERLVKNAQEVGQSLAEMGLTRSAVRNFFGAVRQIEMNWPADGELDAQGCRARRELFLLRPKLTYYAAKESGQSGRGMQALSSVLTPALERVGGDRQRFANFVDYFEAIIAYHRGHGGRER